MAGVLDRADPAPHGQGDEHLLGRAGDHVDHRPALVRRCGDVEEHDFVGALLVVAAGQLDRVAGVDEVGEAHPLDHPAGVDVEAGDHPNGAHAATPSATLRRPSTRARPAITPDRRRGACRPSAPVRTIGVRRAGPADRCSECGEVADIVGRGHPARGDDRDSGHRQHRGQACRCPVLRACRPGRWRWPPPRPDRRRPARRGGRPPCGRSPRPSHGTPPRGCPSAVPSVVEAERDPAGEGGHDRPGRIRILDRRRAQHHPARLRRPEVPRRRQRFAPLPRSGQGRHGGGDPFDHRAVGRLAGPGPVEVDDVQPRGACCREAGGQLHRIAVIASAVEVAPGEPHGRAVRGRRQRHRGPSVAARRPHEVGEDGRIPSPPTSRGGTGSPTPVRPRPSPPPARRSRTPRWCAAVPSGAKEWTK